jgi:hypothetical protein
MREALKNIICPHCGAQPVSEDSYFDEQKLRLENARLKEEVCIFLLIFITYPFLFVSTIQLFSNFQFKNAAG